MQPGSIVFVGKVAQGFLTAPAAIFVCVFGSGWLYALGDPAGMTGFSVLLSYLFANSVGLWVIADAQKRNQTLPYDSGTFVFFAWGVLLPVYLFATRGWRAIMVLVGFGLLYLIAGFLGSALGSFAME